MPALDERFRGRLNRLAKNTPAQVEPHEDSGQILERYVSQMTTGERAAFEQRIAALVASAAEQDADRPAKDAAIRAFNRHFDGSIKPVTPIEVKE